MMDYEQYILGKIAEEASEVAQRAMKSQQYGLMEVQSGETKTNFHRLIDELHDLSVMQTLLKIHMREKSIFYEFNDLQRSVERIQKMTKYAKLGESLGRLDESVVKSLEAL